MQLILDETQRLLETTVEEFVAQKAPLSRIRTFREAQNQTGYCSTLWKVMAEMGWVGLHFPETFGGSGLGFFEFSLLLQVVGRKLMPEPFFSTVVLGAQVLLEAGSSEQKSAWLPEIALGNKTMTLAYDEPKARYNHLHVTTEANKTDKGFVLNGLKTHVLDGGSADGIIVSARLEGGTKDPEGIALFLLEPKMAGVKITNQNRVDGRKSVLLELRSLELPHENLIGEAGAGGVVLNRVMDKARIALSAEMLGGANQAFEITIDYLKERTQFGVPIGSFQALQHRAAELFTQLQVTKSALLAAAKCVDEAPENIAEMASLVKAKCSDVFVQATNEGVQMHGGVGMTDEYDIGLYMKRARATDALLGDASFHRERWATLRGY